jgi:hypothetical protein
MRVRPHRASDAATPLLRVGYLRQLADVVRHSAKREMPASSLQATYTDAFGPGQKDNERRGELSKRLMLS